MTATVQQVLAMSTSNASLRSEAQGWGWEDPRCYTREPVGFNPSWSPGEQQPSYPHVLAALADGWRLLAPPAVDKNGAADWWLVREVER